MSETPSPVVFAWLDPAQVLAWCKVQADSGANAAAVELARQAAADWIEDQRPDLKVTDPEAPGYPYAATPRIIMAGLIATARLKERMGTPAGLVNYGEFAGSVLRNDPDVRHMLGRVRKPAVG
jgi:hypothetical protein